MLKCAAETLYFINPCRHTKLIKNLKTNKQKKQERKWAFLMPHPSGYSREVTFIYFQVSNLLNTCHVPFPSCRPPIHLWGRCSSRPHFSGKDMGEVGSKHEQQWPRVLHPDESYLCTEHILFLDKWLSILNFSVFLLKMPSSTTRLCHTWLVCTVLFLTHFYAPSAYDKASQGLSEIMLPSLYHC